MKWISLDIGQDFPCRKLSGGSGLNLTSAQHVVFLELPTKPAHMQQAECRAHRQGQTKGVNVYIFIAKDTSDELRWQRLNTSLRQVSSTMDGKYDALQAIEVNDVSYLEELDVREKKSEHLTENAGNGEVAGEKPTVTEVQGIHLDLDPFEAHCDPYRIDDKQDGSSSILSKSDQHDMPTTSTIGHEESYCITEVLDEDFSSSHRIDVNEAKEQNLQDKEKGASPELEVNDDGFVTSSSIEVESLRFEIVSVLKNGVSKA